MNGAFISTARPAGRTGAGDIPAWWRSSLPENGGGRPGNAPGETS